MRLARRYLSLPNCPNLQAIRMSWNKYNLYNIAKGRLTVADPSLRRKKLYAQQIASKRVTRKYHGQGLPERVFKSQLYSPKFNVVAGGVEGKERQIWGGLYQGVERRLDTIIYRSLFATSIQQARQMVIHGHVQVNGKKVCIWSINVDIRNLDQDCYYNLVISIMPIHN
jgi:ribosomal protein S4